MPAIEILRKWLGPVPAIDSDTGAADTGHVLHGSNQSVQWTRISGKATVDQHIHGLLDLLAKHHNQIASGSKPANYVQLGVCRGLKTDSALQPLRTLRNAHTGWPRIEIYVESATAQNSDLIPDTGEPPTFEGGTPDRWAGYLSGWNEAMPGKLARAIVQSDPHRLRLYPQLSLSPAGEQWSLRVDGLQVGTVGEPSGTLRVGSKQGSSHKATEAWSALTGNTPEFPFTWESRDEAAALIQKFVKRLEKSPSELLDHGVPEHALESSVVRGETKVTIGGRRLYPIGPDQSEVAYGSQIPTLWASEEGGKARYLDALLRDGQVPWAVEMKVRAGGGYGSYLRHAIGQAVLYRHFLRSAPAYEEWFGDHGLDRHAVRAAVLYPQPTEEVQQKIAGRIGNLWLTAAAFDVQVTTVTAGWLH